MLFPIAVAVTCLIFLNFYWKQLCCGDVFRMTSKERRWDGSNCLFFYDAVIDVFLVVRVQCTLHCLCVWYYKRECKTFFNSDQISWTRKPWCLFLCFLYRCELILAELVIFYLMFSAVWCLFNCHYRRLGIAQYCVIAIGALSFMHKMLHDIVIKQMTA